MPRGNGEVGVARGSEEAGESRSTSAVSLAQADTEERPTKIVTSEVELEVTCQVHTFDFEGRADGRSLRTILSHVAPRKLLVVHAPQEVRGVWILTSALAGGGRGTTREREKDGR